MPMILATPNYISIFTAVISSMTLGMLWYSSAVFGIVWMKLKGFKPKDMDAAKKSMNLTYIFSFLATAIQAIIITQFLATINVTSLSAALQLSVLFWLGFVATTQVSSMLYSVKKFSLTLFLIETGYQLFSLIIMTSLLTVF